MAQSHLGNIKNKFVCSYGVKATPQAANTALTKGQLVYLDEPNGIKVVPITSQPPASKVGVIENASDNNPGTLGAKSVEVYKYACIAVIKLDGTMPVGGKGRASTTTAGRGEKIDDPANSALNATFSDTEVEAELNTLRDFNKFYLFDFLGKADEYMNANKQDTAGADGDEIVIGFK